MSLVDALLLEPYRDPRDVYIALRTDGLKGSGTIDDPYDGGTGLGLMLVASVTLDRKEAIFTTIPNHGFTNGQTILVLGATGASAALFNASFILTKLSEKEFKVTLSNVPLEAPRAADNIRCGTMGSVLGGTLSHQSTLVECMEVTVNTGSAHLYSDNDTVQITGATGSGASWFNGFFQIYGASGSQFIYRLTKPIAPAAGANGQTISTAKFTGLDAFLSWPVAKATTTPNHDYVDQDVVSISGAPDSAFNGECVIIYPVAASGTFYYRLPSIPAADTSYSGLSCARPVYQFDEIMRALPANCMVHLAGGTFETRGFNSGLPSFNPLSTVRFINWLIKSGQRFFGAGTGLTTVKLLYATPNNQVTYAFGQSFFGAIEVDSKFLDGFQISDLTVDCNMRQQVGAPIAKAAIAVTGKHTRVERVRAIDYGTHVNGLECFVFTVARADPRFPEAIDCRIEDCILEQPSFNGIYTNTCMILSSGEEPAANGSRKGWHRGCAIRRNYVNNEFRNAPISIASITISGSVATVNTFGAHNRQANQWVVISGAVVNGSENNSYNGTYQITQALSSTAFKVTLVDWTGSGLPTTSPTGNIWVDRYSSFRISVKKLERDPADASGLTAILTSHTPHNRKPGQWLAVFSTFSPRPAGTDSYYGRFPIVEVTSPTTLKYRMSAQPCKGTVMDTDPNPPDPAIAKDGVFLGSNSVGFSTDGGSEAVAEGNRVFATPTGGSYHDTWSTKDQTDRNNYYSDVLTGPRQLMGGSSPLKLAVSLSVVGTTATVITDKEHDFVFGQAVRIASSLQPNPVQAFYKIETSSPASKQFTFDTEGTTPPGNYFGALWQIGLAVRENNVIELGQAQHMGTYYGPSSGLPFESVKHDSQYVFRSVIARENIIGFFPGGESNLASSLQLGNVEAAIIERNTFDLTRIPQIFVSNSKPLHFFNNQSSSGVLVEPQSGQAADDLTTQIQDALTLAL